MIPKKLIIHLAYPFFYIVKKMFFNKPQLRVLMFHYITNDQFKKFDNLIKLLKKQFHIISPSEFSEIKSGKKKIFKDTILLTFDDGYKSQYIITKKILNKHKIKALYFVTLNFIKIKSKKKIENFLKNNLKVNENYKKNFSNIKNMNKSDIQNLIKFGHKIGAHTINHFDLPNVSSSVQKKEINNYKKNFNKHFGKKKIDHFAFTFGEFKNLDFSSLELSLNSYNFVHTGIRGNNYQSFEKVIFRDNCDLNQSLKEIFFFLNGFGDFYYFFKRLSLNSILRRISISYNL